VGLDKGVDIGRLKLGISLVAVFGIFGFENAEVNFFRTLEDGGDKRPDANSLDPDRPFSEEDGLDGVINNKPDEEDALC